MARVTAEAWYEVIEEPVYDEEGYDCSQYELVGSVPLSAWEVMLMRSQRIECVIDLEMEYLR